MRYTKGKFTMLMSRSISFTSISLGVMIIALFVIAGTTRAAWFEQNHGGEDALRSATAFSEDYLYVVGENGAAYSSNDGGENWTSHDSGTSERLNGVDAAGEVRLFAVGDNGEIRRSTDKGSTWEAQSSSSDEDFNDIDMVTSNIGTIVGNMGTVLTTGNSGVTWTKRSTSIQRNLNGVWHQDNSSIWAVGDQGTILMSTDAGVTWEQRTSSTSADLHDIVFTTGSHGFAVGESGVALETTNSGATWVMMNLTTGGEDLYAVDALDEDNIMIVGEQISLTSTDGGATWTEDTYSNDAPIFHDVIYYSSDVRWAIGSANDIGFVDSFDGTAPTEPTNLGILGGSTTTDDSTPSFSWTASSDAGDVSYIIEVAGGMWETANVVFDLPISLADGDYTIEVIAIDQAGNTSESITLDFTIEGGDGASVSDEFMPGDLIKITCPDGADVNDPCKAVYYYSENGIRHAFPNDKAYFTWYDDFDGIKEISADAMSEIPLGVNVTYRPGVKMVKFVTVNTVYVVSAEVLRPLASEEIAEALYGENWNQQIDDISDAFYGNYTYGEEITDAADYDPAYQQEVFDSIDDVL